MEKEELAAKIFRRLDALNGIFLFNITKFMHELADGELDDYLLKHADDSISEMMADLFENGGQYMERGNYSSVFQVALIKFLNTAIDYRVFELINKEEGEKVN